MGRKFKLLTGPAALRPEIVDENGAKKPFLTTDELAARWNVCRTTLHYLRKRGKLRAKKFGKAVRFAASEVARYEMAEDK